MGFVWDIILVAILIVCIFLAYRKGLIATLFSLLSTVVALLGAWMLSTPVGAWIDQMFVHGPVRRFVLSTLSDTPVMKYDEALNNIDVASRIRSMPAALKTLLESIGLSSDTLVAEAQKATVNSAEMKNQLIDRIADPISATISTAIAFVVLFVVLLVVCSLAAKLLSALCNLLPVGKQLNAIGGGVIGFAKGLIIVLVVSAVLWAVSSGVETKSFFGKETIDTSLVTKEIIKINPICNIFR